MDEICLIRIIKFKNHKDRSHTKKYTYSCSRQSTIYFVCILRGKNDFFSFLFCHRILFLCTDHAYLYIYTLMMSAMCVCVCL